MPPLKYLAGYPEHVLARVRELIEVDHLQDRDATARGHQPAKTRAFVDFLRERFGKQHAAR